jgi:hypothetical protein
VNANGRLDNPTGKQFKIVVQGIVPSLLITKHRKDENMKRKYFFVLFRTFVLSYFRDKNRLTIFVVLFHGAVRLRGHDRGADRRAGGKDLLA